MMYIWKTSFMILSQGLSNVEHKKLVANHHNAKTTLYENINK